MPERSPGGTESGAPSREQPALPGRSYPAGGAVRKGQVPPGGCVARPLPPTDGEEEEGTARRRTAPSSRLGSPAVRQPFVPGGGRQPSPVRQQMDGGSLFPLPSSSHPTMVCRTSKPDGSKGIPGKGMQAPWPWQPKGAAVMVPPLASPAPGLTCPGFCSFCSSVSGLWWRARAFIFFGSSTSTCLPCVSGCCMQIRSHKASLNRAGQEIIKIAYKTCSPSKLLLFSSAF